MPDPILTDFFRAQVVFHGKSGLAEDVYVNNFIFRNDMDGSPFGDVANEIASRLEEFYTVAPPATSGPIKNFLSGHMLTTQYDIKVYNLGEAPPRLPVIVSKDLGTGMTATATNPETAVCLSFYAGRSLPRRRGRVFIGPLGTTALDTSVEGVVQVASGFRDVLAAAGERLASDPIGSVTWHVLSGMDANAFQITGGWVDNALDTQRRRGSEATTRTLWGAPPV